MIDTVGTFIYFRFSIFFEYITGKRDNDFDTVRSSLRDMTHLCIYLLLKFVSSNPSESPFFLIFP